MYKEEPIYLNGKRAGAITSGMYGHRIEASCGLGYIFSENVVTKEWLQHQKIEIEIGWERYDAIASIEPFYDPKSLRLKS
jgi:4-methylaminobutanoate oxidase (formaldehyde-forming)